MTIVLIGAPFMILNVNASPIPSNDFQIKHCIEEFNATLGIQNATLACQHAQYNAMVAPPTNVTSFRGCHNYTIIPTITIRNCAV